MKLYFNSYSDSEDRAKELVKSKGGYYAGNSSILCPHGRCRCCIVYSKDREKIALLIVCEKCKDQLKLDL